MDGYHWDMGRVSQFHACLFHGHGCQPFSGSATPSRPDASAWNRTIWEWEWEHLKHADPATAVTGRAFSIVHSRYYLDPNSDICWEPFYTDTASLGANSLHACLCLECKWDFYECYHKWFPSEACVTHRAEFVDTIVHLGPVLDTWISNVG